MGYRERIVERILTVRTAPVHAEVIVLFQINQIDAHAVNVVASITCSHTTRPEEGEGRYMIQQWQQSYSVSKKYDLATA